MANSTTIVHINALLDAGSNVTLLRENIAHILKLQDENETLKIGNARINSSSVQSNISSFSISSSTHPVKIALEMHLLYKFEC